MKFRILHCIQSLSWGGLELYTVELIKKISEIGVEQIVLCSKHSRVAEELKKTNIEIIIFEEQKISKSKEAKLIRKISQERAITHLHSHTRLDMWACALSLVDRKSPKHVYNLYMNALPKRDLVHKWLFSKVHALCSSSEFVLSEAKKNFPIDPKKLHLIRYGRSTEEYQPQLDKRNQLRQTFGIKEKEIAFGTLCRIDQGKGVRELVEALGHLTDAEIQKIHMLIVGEPTIQGRDTKGKIVYEEQSLILTNWIEEQATTPRLQGHLHRVPFQKDYIPMIDALDIFILGSYNETYSLSVLDAMLMEKPVIGTDAGGTTEQIGKNQRGHLVERKNTKALAEAMRFYIANPNLKDLQGAAAKSWVLEQHQWASTLQKTLQLYKDLL